MTLTFRFYNHGDSLEAEDVVTILVTRAHHNAASHSVSEELGTKERHCSIFSGEVDLVLLPESYMVGVSGESR